MTRLCWRALRVGFGVRDGFVVCVFVVWVCGRLWLCVCGGVYGCVCMFFYGFLCARLVVWLCL